MTTKTAETPDPGQSNDVDNELRRHYRRKRILIIVSAIVHGSLIVIALPLVLICPTSTYAQIVGPLGLIAFASAACLLHRLRQCDEKS